MPDIEPVALHEATRRRYLNYALSVITSRALPDVRDGLKPVQRRILYAMFANLRLLPEGRYRKSAAVVGEVMAKFHPHGDQAIYEAMVRMAQPFSLRHTLVDGQGNFGSLDGDSAAAMRYTECRLTHISIELLNEIQQRTVAFRPTYDGQNMEPVVLPARFPHLLVNGAEGIAVGMATRIPPHNLREVIDACLLLIEDPTASCDKLSTRVKGPDFPTGGVILEGREALAAIYATGQGPVHVRGEYFTEKVGRKHLAVITSIPYGLNKAALVERIGELIAARKVPQILDVRDESTEDVRIALELRQPEDAEAALAYLFKHTPLQMSYPVNLTALVPTRNPEVAAPARLDLRTCLRHWLDFRFETVRRRFEFDLQRLKERIHILEGFEAIFVDLDTAIRLIRQSEGRRDAQERLMDHFDLDDLQADAILELKLYRLARLEIIEIQQELAERRSKAQEIERILSSDEELWRVVREELVEVREKFGVPRKTRIGVNEDEKPAYRDDAYIVAEDTFVIVTRDGWVKRQNSFSDLAKIRVREGDSIGWLLRATTLSTVAFFTDRGSAYVLRVDSIAATTGYGGPVQKHFQFADGEKVVGVVSFDPRNLPVPLSDAQDEGEEPPPPHGLAVSLDGRILRFPLSTHSDVSTRNGRLYMRNADPKEGVVAVYPCPEPAGEGSDVHVCLASEGGRALTFPLSEVKVTRAAGRGLTGIKLREDDRVFAFEIGTGRDVGPLVRTPRGRDVVVAPRKYEGSRGGRGAAVLLRDGFNEWVREPLIRVGDAPKGGEE